jgi:hypothetical protein
MLLCEELESSGFVRLNAGDIQNNCGEGGYSWIVRVRHLLEAGHVTFGDVRLLREPKDVVFVFNGLSLTLWPGLAELHTWILWLLPENYSFGRSCPQILQ